MQCSVVELGNARHARVALALGMLIAIGNGRAYAQDAGPPSAEEILDRYIEVTGGEDAYRALTTEHITATIEVVDTGQEGRFESFKKAPDRMVRKESMGDTGVTTRGTDGSIAWEVGPVFGARLLEGAEQAQFLREARFNAALHWRELYTSAERTGEEDVEGEACHVLKLTPRVGPIETAWYGKDSGLLRKVAMTVETAVGPMDFEIVLTDYKEFDGVRVPTAMTMTIMGAEVRSAIEDVKYNVEIPDGTFAVPEKVRELLGDGL